MFRTISNRPSLAKCYMLNYKGQATPPEGLIAVRREGGRDMAEGKGLRHIRSVLGANVLGLFQPAEQGRMSGCLLLYIYLRGIYSFDRIKLGAGLLRQWPAHYLNGLLDDLAAARRHLGMGSGSPGPGAGWSGLERAGAGWSELERAGAGCQGGARSVGVTMGMHIYHLRPAPGSTALRLPLFVCSDLF